jgi:hypothetical protein
MQLDQLAYEAYRAHTGGVSLATGQPIPEWDALKPEIRAAWRTSTEAVLFGNMMQNCQDLTHYPQSADYGEPCPACQARMSACPEVIRALVLRMARNAHD